MASESKQSPKGITLTDVVLGVVCPPALMGKLAIEAAEIKAKERKERKPEPSTDLDMVMPCILIAIAVPLLVYAWATGQVRGRGAICLWPRPGVLCSAARTREPGSR